LLPRCATTNLFVVPFPLLRESISGNCANLLDSDLTSWQPETCIGEWHYHRGLYEKPGEYGGYLPPRDVIHWIIDTVSKNGTFILSVPGKPDGTIDSKEIAVLDDITAWTKRDIPVRPRISTIQIQPRRSWCLNRTLTLKDTWAKIEKKAGA
jgi:alpha-L-fucosidase